MDTQIKKYRVYASYSVFTHVDIEAENISEAKEIAYNMDGDSFHGRIELGDWNIDNIVERE
jgi:hypothetical protein